MAASAFQHYHLVCGEILFHEKGDESALGSIRMNTMLRTERQELGTRHLGLAQQQLQVLFFQRVDPTVVIVDVPITGITHLGRMTEEQFMAAPAGMAIQEVSQDEAEELTGEGPKVH